MRTRCYCCGQEHSESGQCYPCMTKEYCLECRRIKACGCGRPMGYHEKCKA